MKTWITIPTTELGNIDYSNLAITNADSAPKNRAGDTALIKWYGDMPNDIANISNIGTELTHDQAMALLNSAEWQEDLGGA